MSNFARNFLESKKFSIFTYDSIGKNHRSSTSENPDKKNSSSTQTQLKHWRVQSTNDTPIGKLSQRTIRNIPEYLISLWVIQENPVFFLLKFSENQASFDWNFFEDRVEGFLGEAFWFSVDFLDDFVEFDCSWSGLEWKIDESFRRLGFFFSGWVEQSRPTQLGSKDQFSGTGKRDLFWDFLLDSRNWLEFLWLFARPLFESPPALLPPDSDATIFLLLGWPAAKKLTRIPATSKHPANPSNFTHNSLSAAGEIPKIPRNFQPKIEWKNRPDHWTFSWFVEAKTSDKEFPVCRTFQFQGIRNRLPSAFFWPHALLTKFAIKIPCFRAVQWPGLKNEISWEFLSNFSGKINFLWAQGNSESRPKSCDQKNCPRWHTVRAARDENALKLVATEKLSSFFFVISEASFGGW